MIFLICVFPNLAGAADISTLQTALSLGRENMAKAKIEQDAKVKAVTEQQQIVAERKKQLADESRLLEKMQKDAKQAGEDYLQAQQKYKKTQADFDAAWGKK